MIEAPSHPIVANFAEDESIKDTIEGGLRETTLNLVNDEASVPVMKESDHNPKFPERIEACEHENTTTGRDKLVIPRSGMIFGSLEEIKTFYNKYAYGHGFGVIVRTSGKKNKDDDDDSIRYHTLTCARSGKPTGSSKNTFGSQPSSKCDCKARVNIKEWMDGRVCITSVVLGHNHRLSPEKSRFLKGNKKLDLWVKRKLELNDQAGISLNKNFHSLVVEAGGYENLKFGERDARNYIDQARRLRLGEGDAESLNNYFSKMHEMNPNFFYRFQVNDDGRIRNIFWADARSRAAYESFNDVITFDTTYLTNKYDMPFAPFVGVNHHGQSILLGCGLLSDEKMETYVWLFKIWLECMLGVLPKAIVTDQCKSIGGAISVVFQSVKHRLCLWHIMKKVPIKLGRLKEYKAVKKTFKNIVYESLTEEEFEESWLRFITDYKLEEHEWLGSLYVERKRWIPVFVKDTFWAGMSTTQRSEGMNAFFDGYVNSKTSLKQFVEQYDLALRSKVEKEKQADFASYNSVIAIITRFPIEKQLQGVYTNEIFKLFQNELKGLIYCSNTLLVKTEGSLSIFKVDDSVERKDGSTKEVTYNVYFVRDESDIRCTCCLFEFKGIICRHVISVLTMNGVKELPDRYILKRWRKDIKRKYTYVKSPYSDVGDTDEMKRYDQLCNRFHDVAELGAMDCNRYEFVLKIIEYIMHQLLSEELICVDGQLRLQDLTQGNNKVSNSEKQLLSPVKVCCKGRPPLKRKLSKEEQLFNNKKKKENNEEKRKQMEEVASLRSQNNMDCQMDLSNSQGS